MKIILLSGGSGKRLWPLSNNTRAKQFLKLLPSKNGKSESMLERVWSQLKELNLIDSVYLSSSHTQIESIHNQLGQNLPIILEPEQRDTFAAISSAVVYLSSVENLDEEEIVCILPVDPFVETNFFKKVIELSNIVRNDSTINIGLIGVSPTFPSQKYGYILSNPLPNKKYNMITQFIEKPNSILADNLIKQGALWNTGIFAFKIGFIMQLLKEKGIPTTYEEIIKNYHDLPKTSFDYEIVERTNNMAVITYQGEWKDLGTWNTV